MEANYFTIFWWFLPWIMHRCTCVPPSWTPFHLLPHPILLGCSRVPGLSALLHAWNLHWSSVLCMVMYMSQCWSLRSSPPRRLPQSPKVCPLRLRLLCCPACRTTVYGTLSSRLFSFYFQLQYFSSIVFVCLNVPHFQTRLSHAFLYCVWLWVPWEANTKINSKGGR